MAEYTPRLQKHYNDVVLKELSSTLSLDNKMEIPKIVKVVINMGIGAAKEHANWLTQAVEEITTITGQKPVVTKAKKGYFKFQVKRK